MKRRFLHTALALVALAAVAGCDNAQTTRPDAELIVGTWLGETLDARTVVGLSVPVLDLASSGDVARFVFRANGTYEFLFDPADGRTLDVPNTSVSIPLDQAVSFSGNYTLDEAAGTIFLSATTNLPVGLMLEYRFSGDDELGIIADDAETLALLVGIATDSQELQLLASVVTGGSITYARN